jgi:hypothetical protein
MSAKNRLAHSSADTSSLRTLSKSDYILARSCRAKLFFRENGYSDKRDGDQYLQLLAEGGYMVEALAKTKYPEGVQPEYGRGTEADFAETLRFLNQDVVTLFEPTLVVGRRQARVDILVKRGSTVRLIEVKAKSFDGQEHLDSLAKGAHGAFRQIRKPAPVRSEWLPKLEDLTYQVLLLEQLMPGVKIQPFLALIDKSKQAKLDNVPRFFELVRSLKSDGTTRLQTARYTGAPEQLADLDLITEVDMSAEVEMLRGDVDAAASWFEAFLDAPLATYQVGLDRGSKCASCEFRHDTPGVPNGFADCWGDLATPKPHMLELYRVGSARAPDRSDLISWMVENDKSSLLDIPIDGLVNAKGDIGPVPERQRRQIEHTRTGEIFVGPELAKNIDALRGPLFFIDFETSRLALPYHAGMRPYGLVSFQWSCHTVSATGEHPTHSEWLNDLDVWPNHTFAKSLRGAIGDEGPVLTWSHFEGSVLNEIIKDLESSGRSDPELVGWIKAVVDTRIVDLHRWAETQYYHPGMRGRTSIKVVLDALWKSDAAMRSQFEAWSGLIADSTADPYSSLPPVEINGVWQDVHEGTGAMRAYQEMMYGFGSDDPDTKSGWAELLRQYCKLDTLSMVLIFEHWRRLTMAAAT